MKRPPKALTEAEMIGLPCIIEETEDGKVNLKVSGHRESVLWLSRAGWSAARIATTLKVGLRWVKHLRADLRRAGAWDGVSEIQRAIQDRIVPQAVENVAEMLENEDLRKKRPNLVYQMSKDALQRVPFQVNTGGAPDKSGPAVTVNVMALPGVTVEVKTDA